MSKRRPDPTSPAPGGLPDYAQDLQRASEGARGRLPEIFQEIDAATALAGELLAKSGAERSAMVRTVFTIPCRARVLASPR